MTITNRILREAEAAKALGISHGAMRWHRRRGTGPAWVRVADRAVGYLTSDLEAWIAGRRVGGTSSQPSRSQPEPSPALIETMLARLAERDLDAFDALMARLGH